MAPTKKLQYSEEDLRNALIAVENGMSFYKASQVYNIPKTTLIYKKSGKTPMERRMGPETILTTKEENLIVQWIFRVADRGFPVSKHYLLDSVQLLIKKTKRPNPFLNNRPGRKWYEAFLRRHPEISVRVSQNLTSSRSQVTEEKIRSWFSEVSDYLKTNSFSTITEDPKRIFNCDESAFFLSPKDNKVLVRKGEKAVYNFIGNDEKECITTLIMCNAAGDLPPPMLVFSYKRIPQKIVERVPDSWGIGHTENGWMTGESFFEYITNVFYNWLINSGIELPIILFVDGHSSHLTMALSDFCSQHGIILVCLHPNSTHILQPLDVAFFHPLKNQWKKTVYQWRIDNGGKKLAREEFAGVLKSAIYSLENIEGTLKHGFRTCGLHPFTPDNINFDKIFKACKTKNDEKKLIESQKQQDMEKFLEYMKRDIPDKVAIFEQSGVSWTGAVEDKSLFCFWKKLRDQIEKRDISIGINNTSPQTNRLIEEVLVENQGIHNLEYLETNDIYIPIEEEEYDTLINAKPAGFDNSETHILIDVPAASCSKTYNEVVPTVPSPKSDNNDLPAISSPQINSDLPAISSPEIINDLPAISSPQINSDLPAISSPEIINDLPDISSLEINNNDVPVAFIAETHNNTDEPNPMNQSPEPVNRTADIQKENVAMQKTPPKKTESSERNDLIQIPTPFKEAFNFWPEKDTKNQVAKRKPKEKVPAVASSEQWKLYFKNKEEKKEIKEREKEARKQARMDKKNEKKTGKSKHIESSDLEESEGETEETEAEETEKKQLKYEGYVIVKYDNDFFPGVILDSKKDENEELEVRVKVMSRSGLNWKWPEHEDILWYAVEDVIENIDEPLRVTKRGSYYVKEITKYYP